MRDGSVNIFMILRRTASAESDKSIVFPSDLLIF